MLHTCADTEKDKSKEKALIGRLFLEFLLFQNELIRKVALTFGRPEFAKV